MPYIGNPPAERFTSFAYQDLTGGSGTSFTLDNAVGNPQEIEVFVNNVRQEPGVAYTVSGTGLTMTGSVASTDDFYVVFQGKAIQTATHPSDRALTATDGTFTGDASVTGDLTVDTNTLHVDAANNRVGAGTVSPDTTMHIHTSSAGTVDAVSGGVLTLEKNNHAVLQFLTPNDKKGIIYFGDPDDIDAGRLEYDHSSNSMLFNVNASERMRIQSGGGISFNGDTATANALNDYEEGTWTPNVGGTATYSEQTGMYTKVGNIVHIYGELRITLIGTGNVTHISGLPFNGNDEYKINISKLVDSNTSVYYANLRTSGSNLYLAFQNGLDGTWTNNPSFLQSSTQIQFSGTYLTDA